MVLFLFVVMMAVLEVGRAHCSKLKTDIIIILHYRHLLVMFLYRLLISFLEKRIEIKYRVSVLKEGNYYFLEREICCKSVSRYLETTRR